MFESLQDFFRNPGAALKRAPHGGSFVFVGCFAGEKQCVFQRCCQGASCVRAPNTNVAIGTL